MIHTDTCPVAPDSHTGPCTQYEVPCPSRACGVEHDITLPEPEPEHDPVDHPAHYASGGPLHSFCGKPIECIDVARTHDFVIGNAIKYLWRAGKKGDTVADHVQDLRKAVWYIEDRIAMLESGHE